MDKKELEQKVDEILSRSVKEILPSREALKERMMAEDKMKIYIGTDATGASLHLGHATNYIILEKFRQLGHEVIFLIGDFTSRIGDPTDKSAARVQLTREQVIENTKTWLNQVRPLIKIDDKENPVKIVYNHDWLSKLTFEDVIDIASNFTVQRMLERDMFEKRLKEEKPIYLHEFFYPLMQGYDSVALDVDIEMCGSDQKFNALAGRTLLKKYKNKEKFVFITTLLENPKTGEKMMSKSLGTGVFIDWDANKMFGSIMAQPDENMNQLFIDTTFLSLEEIDKVMKSENPRDAKMRLAWEIVKIYHGKEEADKAQEYFINIFSKKELPEDIAELTGSEGENIVDFIIRAGFATSKGDARRKIEQGGVSIDGEKIPRGELILTKNEFSGKILKVGKINFVKIVF
ncbi:MAG: hypothetical protein ACD_7C00122G0001 [uncultured bacterium]|nr:MAG: hypothetical protein ACD_7C00122G0001 [uncultured bacterium]